ncbi:MAG: FAD:protein FMN transferase [Solimonas sp.]
MAAVVRQRQVYVPLELAGLPQPAGLGAIVRTLHGESMGTRWTVRLVLPPGLAERAVRAAIEAELARVVAQMSTWLPSSDLCRYNAAPAGSWLTLPAEFYTVLRAAQTLARDTAGAYDATAGALVDLWGFGPQPRRDTPPSPAEIGAARALGGWSRLQLDDDGRRACQPGGLRLDLSSIAKGYGVDLVCAALQSQGCEHFLVEVGGELRGHGCKPDGSPWWVALERPPQAEALPEALIALHGLSVATSGDYRRGFEFEGRHYAHTLDPRSGYPVMDGPAVVIVVHRECMQADALATALSVLGSEAGHAYAQARGIAASFVQREGDTHVERLTPALAALLE